MRKLLLLVPLIVLLTGCPGKDGAKMSKHRSIYIDGERVCFTVDKKDVLTRYGLTTNGADYKELMFRDSVRLTYPDTCFNANLEKGVAYNATYAIDGENYYFTFIIDNENNVVDLKK